MTITLGTPSSTGQSEAPSNGLLAGTDRANATDARLRRLCAEGLDIARRRVAERQATVPVPLGDHASRDAVSGLEMGWPVGTGPVRRSLRPFRDKAEPP